MSSVPDPAVFNEAYSGKERDASRQESPRVASARSLALLALGVWFAVACVAGLLGVVDQPGRPPLVLLAFLVLPAFGFVTAYLRSPSFATFADGISLPMLVGSHVWRFVGIGFVIGVFTGDLPAGFGIPEGLGDVVAAAGALLLLPRLRAGSVPRGWLLAWNTFGLVDLLSAMTMGLLYSNSALGILSPGTVTTRVMVTFPVSLIPTFFVPLFLLVHALIFKRIAALGPDGESSSRASVEGTSPS